MNVIEVSIEKLKLADKNVRTHNKIQIEEFARSLAMFGQIRPVVIDSDNSVLCGNGMVLAARHLGWSNIKVLVMGNVSDAQKKKLMIADNRIFELGSTNNAVLDEFFQLLADDLDIPGYDEEMLQMIVGDTQAVNEQIMDYGKLESEKVAEIVNNEQVLQNRIEKAGEQTASVGQANDITSVVAKPFPEGETGEPTAADVQRYIICPKCGEKICL